ncbi:ras-related protein Rab-24-like isoform X1 [Stylophora pistillata]|uniref:Ras-related protein Rab-24 n=1 Tax=Stylophora pistillata TaxID=50429 RepID=A0A2B4RZL6_STYPI|nr:ras-related protein Rab-24-like isoform X1 [Stylophora pistillata]PFX22596.1 Ras-related protein Rab-24 [Stylophora pistillata]
MGSREEKKVIIVGKYCVGKTALIESFTTNRFNELSSYEPTIGAAFVAKKVTVGKKYVTLGIWDTAGSERFESMTTLYYRGAEAAIICYDVCDYSSFEKAKFYATEVRQNNESCGLYLCGTKCDLVSFGGRNREVTRDEAEDYAQKINARKVIATSSKTGENVTELFSMIAKDLLKKIPTENSVPSHQFGLHEPTQNAKPFCGCKG